MKVALAAALAAWLPRSGGMPEPALARIAGGRAVQHEACVLRGMCLHAHAFHGVHQAVCDCRGTVRPAWQR